MQDGFHDMEAKTAIWIIEKYTWMFTFLYIEVLYRLKSRKRDVSQAQQTVYQNMQ